MVPGIAFRPTTGQFEESVAPLPQNASVNWINVVSATFMHQSFLFPELLDFFIELTFGAPSWSVSVGNNQTYYLEQLDGGVVTTINNVTLNSTRFSLINTGFGRISRPHLMQPLTQTLPTPQLGNFMAIFELDSVLEQHRTALGCSSGPVFETSCSDTRSCCDSSQRCARHTRNCNGTNAESWLCIPL